MPLIADGRCKHVNNINVPVNLFNIYHFYRYSLPAKESPWDCYEDPNPYLPA